MPAVVDSSIGDQIAFICKVHNIPMEDAYKALEALANPTLRPIVGIREFICSPWYMNAPKAVYPKIMSYLEEANNGEYSEAVFTGSIGCLTADTEFLTPTGWVRMDSYDGQAVGEYNTTTGQLEFRLPKSHIARDCQWFYYFKTKYGVDMALSPEHSVLYRNTKGDLVVTQAQALADSYESNKNGLRGTILTTFKAPTRHGVKMSDAQLRLQVAVRADGYFDYQATPKFCRVSVKKLRKIARLRLLLNDAKVGFEEKDNPDRPGFKNFKFYAPLHSKDFEWAWDCTKSQLEVITSEAMFWDGCGSTQVFATTSKATADFIQYAYAATGRRAAITQKPNPSSLCKGEANNLYRMAISDRTEPSMQSRIKGCVSTVPSPDGKKYCFETTTGFFVARRNGRVFVTGNSGKTTAALYTIVYQLYILSCYESPHALYDLDPASEIVFIFQSLNRKSATNDYNRFYAMVQKAPYFKKYFPFDPDLKTEMKFPQRIIVRPVSGSETAAIGENVFGGMIDEINFMSVIENAKNGGEGGVYDQAVALYNSISKRRKSRFGMSGKLPGMLCVVSSRRYPGQFTDKKEEEAAQEIADYGKTSIYLYSKRVWEVKEGFPSDMFPVFLGDEARRPRLLTRKEVDEWADIDSKLLDWIPVNFYDDFKRDIITAIRDIAGWATLAKHPFIVDREAIGACVRPDYNCFSRERVDFVETQLSIIPSQFYKPELPRFFHCDLAISGDSAGFAVGTVTGFKSVTSIEGIQELLPIVHIDAMLEVAPPKGGEIRLWKIRDIIHALRKAGMNIKWGTFDQFQCVSGNTSIWTDHGLVDARHVQEGMVVQSRIGPRPVTRKWAFGVQPTICMTTTDHSILDMTPNHKIEVAVDWHWPTTHRKQHKRPVWGWRRADELKVGDVVRTWSRPTEVDVAQPLKLPLIKRRPNSINYVVPKSLTPALAEFLGVVWGDGYIREDEVSVACADGEQQCAAEVFKRVFNCTPSIRKTDNHYVVSLYSRDLTRWLSVCGFEKTDFIPELIKHSPIAVQAAFVRGLFSTDGSVGTADGACTFSTQHWEWAEYVHVFLRSAFGISSCIVKSKREGDHYATLNDVQYIVSVRGSRHAFYTAVGFCYKGKQAKLEKHLDVQGRELWTKVESLEPSEAEVFDFEVAEDHAYIANGLVSHNSRDGMQLLKQAGLGIGYQSIDINCDPYEFTKNAIYDKRLTFPPHARCQRELASLEKNTKKAKIDHPPGSSKDVSDALAGVVYGLTMRREIWALYGVQSVQLPSSIKTAINKEKQDKITSNI